MVFDLCREYFAVWAVIVSVNSATCQEAVWKVTSGSPLVADLPAYGEVILHAGHLSAANSTSSVTCQIHTQIHNLTLSFNSDLTYDTAVTGQDVGVISLLSFGQTEAHWYLRSAHNFSVRVLVAVTELTDQDPLPGGCNIEFNLENDANVLLRYTDWLTVLSFQWALVAFSRGDHFSLDCLVKDQQNSLTYDVFGYYLTERDTSEEGYFNALKHILNQPTDTDQLGTKLASLTYKDKSNVTVTSYAGQGALYIVRVRQKGRGSALYFPVMTYGCSLDASEEGSCEQVLKANVAAIVLTTIGGIVGLFICFLGHRFLKTEMFIFGFLACSLVTYIGLFVVTDASMAVRLGVSASVGVLGGALWWLVWWGLGVPVLSVLLCGLVAGFLFSCLLFFTPFGGLHYWKNSFNFGMTFSCSILILPVFLLIFTRMLNILSCAFVGSFGIVLAADTYLQSHLKYIILNIFRRFVSPDFSSAVQIVPFSINEIILSIIWGLLFISGTVFQYVREKKRPPFPPCPRRKRRARALFHHHTQTANEDDERQPLLRNGRTEPNYSRTRVLTYPPGDSPLPQGTRAN